MDRNFIENFAWQILNNLNADSSNLLYNDLSSNNISVENIRRQITWRPTSLEISSNIPSVVVPEEINISNRESIPRNIYYRSFFIPLDENTTNHEDISFVYNNTLTNHIIISNNIEDNSSNNNNSSNYITNYYRRNNRYNRSLSLREMLRYIYSNYNNYNNENNDNLFLENFINSTFENDKKKFKKVISDSEKYRLKPQKFYKKNEENTNIQCPIFCYEFEENEEIIKLPCNHNYNIEAITKWLTEESNTCPICRYEFDYKEINTDNKRQELENYTYNYPRLESNDEEQIPLIQTQNSNNEENTNEQNTNYYNLLTQEEILLQEILFNMYTNDTNNTNDTNDTNDISDISDISDNFTMI